MDEKWMKKAIDLAKKGSGYTNPNPMVGAVVVKDGKLIGEGYHEKYGGNHGEINAIKSVEGSCKGATIYVTLEPCFHYGNTPPCVDAIIRECFMQVVIGMKDPNPQVAGKSIEKLRRHGIKVTTGILEEECRHLNFGFIKLMEEKKPYVVMKSAMTLDGKITTATGESRWITGYEARKMVHEIRHELHGIMVGINTVIMDDAMLTSRRVLKSMQPIRIIIDSKGRMPIESKIVRSATKYRTILITTNQIDEKKKDELEIHNVEVEVVSSLNGRVDINDMMLRLGALNITSILLEGGGTLNDSMLRNGHVDEVISFIAPKIFGGDKAKTPVAGDGISNIEDAFYLDNLTLEKVGDDICIRGKVIK